MDFTTPTTYHFPTSIRFGAGVINELSSYLSEQGLTKPLLVTDPVLEHLPVFKNVLEQLNLQPDKIDIHRVNNLLNENISIGEDNEDLLDHTLRM
mgnify:CR=1 FL=1